MQCPVSETASVIGKKWTIALLDEIALNGSEGYNHILRRMKKVSAKVLAQRLDELEQQQLVEKTITAEKPVKRTSYALTAKGKELQVILTSIKKWQVKHNASLPCLTVNCTECRLY